MGFEGKIGVSWVENGVEENNAKRSGHMENSEARREHGELGNKEYERSMEYRHGE